MSDLASRSETSDPVYFWRATETCGFLSQWYHAPFVAPAPETDAPTMTFSTCEQYMMYHKAILFEDFEIAEQILETPTPSMHKALGRQVKGFDEKVWQKNRETIVEDGNWYKFSSSENSHLCKMLLETGDRELAEAAPNDRIWGIGYNARKAHENRKRWGINLLGKALMRVRNRLRVQGVASSSLQNLP